MATTEQVFRAFVWFLWQCSIVGGLGAPLFWFPAACLSALMVVSFSKSPVTVRRRFWWLAVLPAIWIAVGLWGSYFWVDTRLGTYQPNPSWVSWTTDYGLWLFLVTAFGLIAFMRRGRTFAVLFALVNLYFMLGMSLMAGMAISGEWL